MHFRIKEGAGCGLCRGRPKRSHERQTIVHGVVVTLLDADSSAPVLLASFLRPSAALFSTCWAVAMLNEIEEDLGAPLRL
jgi:hypothetical protein